MAFSEKPLIAQYKWERVPVLVDDNRGVVDSWTIANYLEDTYGDRPSLFGGAIGTPMGPMWPTWAGQSCDRPRSSGAGAGCRAGWLLDGCWAAHLPGRGADIVGQRTW